VEVSGQFRIKVCKLPFLDENFFMALIDMVIDPLLERLAKSRIDNVGQPLTGQQVEFFLIRQIVHKLWVLLSLLKHSFDRYVLVLRAENLKVLV
jgi:hypothetical protein